MKALRLALVGILYACHPVPASASDIPDVDHNLRTDAHSVCVIAGVGDQSECIELVSSQYFDATMQGALAERAPTASDAVYRARAVTGCQPIASKICKAHVTNWATWYMYGSMRVKHDANLLQDSRRYSNGDPDFIGKNSGYDDQVIPYEDLREYHQDEPYESQYNLPGDMDY